MTPQVVIPVADSSQVGEARRAAVKMAIAAEFSAVDQGRVGIVATELSTNLVRHAKQGKLLLQILETSLGRVVELLSVDSGSGIGNVEQSLQDGYSTAGTPGNGLGAIQRLSDEFDIYSQREPQPEQGTVVLSRIRRTTRELIKPAKLAWGAVSIPAPNETECGDCWRLHEQDGQLSIMVADGLGHGPLAALAAEKAAQVFEAHLPASPQAVLQQAHQALNGTRGAALAIARVDSDERFLKYAGVGNISGRLFADGQSRGLCSHNGTIGVLLRKVQEFEYPRGLRDLLVMHSDGLQSRWTFEKYPGLILRHPAIIAGVLFRDFERGRDDLTVVVARLSSFKA